MGRFPHELKALPRRELLELLHSRTMSNWRERRGLELVKLKREADKDPNEGIESMREKAHQISKKMAEEDQWTT